MTSQINLDSYMDAGVLTAIRLVNELPPSAQRVPTREVFPLLADILSFDRQSRAQLRERDVPRFVVLAEHLREVLASLRRRNVDGAAAKLNELLAEHPAHPHLAKEEGVWRLHHHPADAALAPMYTSICAEGIARMIGGGSAERFGACEAGGCERVFFDTSKNASRRFCSTTCQNREKTAAFRQRRAATRR